MRTPYLFNPLTHLHEVVSFLTSGRHGAALADALAAVAGCSADVSCPHPAPNVNSHRFTDHKMRACVTLNSYLECSIVGFGKIHEALKELILVGGGGQTTRL